MSRPALIALLSLIPFALFADDKSPSPRTATLTDAVTKLVALRREAQKEKLAWREQKTHLKDIELALTRESAILAKKINAHARKDGFAQKERQALIARGEKARKRLRGLSKQAPGLALQLLKTYNAIPESLKEKMGKQVDAIQTLSGQKGSTDLLKDYRRLFAFADSIRQVQRTIHVVKERLRDSNGNLREVDVIYLGTSSGWFVSADGKWAGARIRKKGGWTVVENTALAALVQKAIAVVRKETMPQMVTLPVAGEVK